MDDIDLIFDANDFSEYCYRHNTGTDMFRFLKMPRAVFEDGYSVSIQGDTVGVLHCSYSHDHMMFDSMELGFPSEEDDLIASYAEDPENPTETIYAYVPVDVINELIKKHGGINLPKTIASFNSTRKEGIWPL